MATFALNSAVNFRRLLVFVLVIFFPFRFCKDNHFNLWSKFQGALYFYLLFLCVLMGNSFLESAGGVPIVLQVANQCVRSFLTFGYVVQN